MMGNVTMLVRNTLITSVAAVIMIMAGASFQDSVTLPSQGICAITGSTVDIPCKYTGGSYWNVEFQWYKNSVEETGVLSEQQNSEKVYVSTSNNDCQLTIKDVRVSDSGFYKIRLKETNQNNWTSGSSGVYLTVAGLKVEIFDFTVRRKRLQCTNSCKSSRTPQYMWYKNGQLIPHTYSNLYDSYHDAGSYSCAVKGHEKLRSPAVCLFNQDKCWSVTYTPQKICALIGTSVDIHTYYTFPNSNNQKVTNFVWFIDEWPSAEPEDLKEQEEYQGRVQYNQSSQNDCSMTISHLRETDAHTYKFRFHTDDPGGKYTGQAGVILSVTGLTVKVVSLNRGVKTLRCITSCSLSQTPYIWYRNGQPIAYEYSNLYDSYHDAGSYSCAVKGHEKLRSPAVCLFNQHQCWSVTYTPQKICALIGTSVDIHTYYTFPNSNNQKVTNFVWFIDEWPSAEPEDLKEQEEYQGRVQYNQSSQNDCSMTISHLRETDAHTYKFRFHTDDPGGKYTGQAGVTLSVTGLKVEILNSYRYGKRLFCKTSCSLSQTPYYIWYRNGQPITNKDSDLYVNNHNAGSYSCAVKGHEKLRSPAVCLFNQDKCWSVTYTPQKICALIGTSVDIHTYYTFPNSNNQKVTNFVWFIDEWPSAEPKDLKEQEEYQGRVQYNQSSQNDCSMTISHLRKTDAHTYKFKFHTDDPGGKYTGQTGVILSVTDLQVSVEALGRKTVRLICSTTCHLPNNPTYMWYINGQCMSRCVSASCIVAPVSEAVNYSCAVKGHESNTSPPVYVPTNTIILPTGDIIEGSSVTLTCNSDANPLVLTYSWFKQTANTILATGQNYRIINISSQQSGLYYCTAHNQLGQSNSSTVRLDVLYSPKNAIATFLPTGDRVEGSSVALTCSSDANPPVLSYSWFKQGAVANTLLATGQIYNITNISSQNSGLFYCSARNKLGQSNSTAIHLDVLYPPRLPSVSTHMSGDFIMLLCQSDSNPTSAYTWYRRTESSVVQIENGTNLTLAVGSDGHFYCMARNQFGSNNSTELSITSDNTAMKIVACGISMVLLLILIVAFLRIRGKMAPTSIRSQENATEMSLSERSNREHDCAPVYGNISALPMISQSTKSAAPPDQDDVYYASVHVYSPAGELPLNFKVQQPNALEQEDVQYSTVNFTKRRADTRLAK